MPDLQFPLDDAQDYKGRIVFGVIEEPEATLTSEQLESVQNALNDPDVSEENQEGQVEELKTNVNTNVHKNGSPSNQSQSRPSTGKVTATCQLYLPSAIQIADGAIYENVSLGRGGAIGEAAIKGGADLAGAAGSVAGDQISSLVDAFSGPNSGEIGKLAAAQVASKFGDTAGAAVSSALQVTPNPNVRALFKGVALREFAFTFKLIPRSQQEAEQIKKIVQFFREELYPEEIGNIDIGQQSVSLGYNFPNKFDIKMYYGDKRVATKIQPCFLRNFSTNYNASSMGMFYDGNFTEIDINMSFMETKTLSRKDIGEGF